MNQIQDYSFLRASEKHCPNCGHLGVQAERKKIQALICKSCKTEYNNYVVLADGEEFQGENN